MINIADCIVENGVIVKEMVGARQHGARDPTRLRSRRCGPQPDAGSRRRVGALDRVGEAVVCEECRSRNRHSVRCRRVKTRSRLPGERSSVAGKAIPRFSTPRMPRTACYTVLRCGNSPAAKRSSATTGLCSLRSETPTLVWITWRVSLARTDGVDLAVRWSVRGSHEGMIYDMAPTGKPLFILGRYALAMHRRPVSLSRRPFSTTWPS